MAETKSLEFVVLYEKNHKENELFIFYLQWTGKEENITKLHKITSKAEYDDMYGDYSWIGVDIDVKIPESAVDLHCKLWDPNGYNRLFTKCTGKFIYPFDEEHIEMNEYELESLIDSTFYSCRIMNMFK